MRVGGSPGRKGLLFLAEGLGLRKSHRCNSCLTPRGSPVRGELSTSYSLWKEGRNPSCGFPGGRQALPDGSGSSGLPFSWKILRGGRDVRQKIALPPALEGDLCSGNSQV